MKIALDWIAEYLTRPLAPAEAENALINAGLPLESNEPVGNTHVLDVEVTSNRTDCLCHIGLARELASLLPNVAFKMPNFAVHETATDIRPKAKVRVEDAVGCPYYSARLIENVKIGPSPDWLVRRLESIGLRSVNNVVDITNFVLMETGQPLHAFDFDKLNGKEIIVRRAHPGEKITAINDKEYALSPTMLVIADAARAVAVAGVMGGKDTEVSTATRTILLESARFDPVTIRAQARALALASDSSYRFERGIDPAAAERASLRAAQLIHELASGTVSAGMIAVGTAAPTPRTVTMRTARVKTILGYDIPESTMTDILARLGFDPRATAFPGGASDTTGGQISCTIPSHRLDIDREIDLIEEIARVHGYDKIPLYTKITHGVHPEPPREKARRTILDTLTAAGFCEAITVTFVDETEAKLFLPAERGGGDTAAVRVRDAVRKASNVLRPSLLPSLLAVRRTNQNAGNPSASVFEHGATIWQTGNAHSTPPREEKKLALIGNSVAQVKGALETLARRLSADAAIIVVHRGTAFPGGEAIERKLDATYPWYAAGVGGTILLTLAGKTTTIGHLGLFSADVQKQYDLRHDVAGAEVSWEPLIAAFEPVRRAKPLPKYPGIRRDLSVVVADQVRWADISAAVAGLPFLENVDFVGTFRNKQIGEGKKSLTLTLEFRDPAGTLRSEQVDEQIKSAVEILGQKAGATIRA